MITDYKIARGGEGGWTHLWLMSPCFSNLDLQQNWGQETEAMLRTRFDFTRLCQFNIKQDYRLRDCARGGGVEFWINDAFVQSWISRSKKITDYNIARGGVTFLIKFSILLNMDMDFKIKRDYWLQRSSYAHVDFARPKVDHADTSYVRRFA